MKIKFTRSGGFAPTCASCELDTAEMPFSEARVLEGLVAASGILGLQSGKVPDTQDAPYFLFEITDGTAGHKVTFSPNVPDSVKPLLDFLQKHAKDQMPQM